MVACFLEGGKLRDEKAIFFKKVGMFFESFYQF